MAASSFVDFSDLVELYFIWEMHAPPNLHKPAGCLEPSGAPSAATLLRLSCDALQIRGKRTFAANT